jgi:hypothetical protein
MCLAANQSLTVNNAGRSTGSFLASPRCVQSDHSDLSRRRNSRLIAP